MNFFKLVPIIAAVIGSTIAQQSNEELLTTTDRLVGNDIKSEAITDGGPPDAADNTTCKTKHGEVGSCMAFHECYPMLSVGEPTPMNYQLQQDILASTTPCGTDPSAVTKDTKAIICCVLTNSAPGVDVVFVDALTAPLTDSENDVRGASTKNVSVVESSCAASNVVAPSSSQATAPRGGYPWMAALINSRRMQFCGGSLVDNYHILTAAHCIAHYRQAADLSKLTVYLGSHNLAAHEDQSEAFKVSRIMRHAKYSDRTFVDDIALLKLAKPANTGGKFISPICLNSGDEYSDGATKATLAGWGKTCMKCATSPILRHGTMRVWKNSECQQKYSQYGSQIPKVQSTMVCAGSPGIDACQGDSGGPLFLKQGGNTYSEQIGIVSWGVGCGQYPGVYTRVDKYISWINKNRGITKG